MLTHLKDKAYIILLMIVLQLVKLCAKQLKAIQNGGAFAKMHANVTKLTSNKL